MTHEGREEEKSTHVRVTGPAVVLPLILAKDWNLEKFKNDQS
jgi:hypothetical protein